MSEDEARRLAEDPQSALEETGCTCGYCEADEHPRWASILAERDKLARQVEKLADWCGIDMVDLDERTGEVGK